MTKKDFELLARVLRETMPVDGDDLNPWLAWRQVAENLASALQNAHPRFNTERFLEACGLEINQ